MSAVRRSVAAPALVSRAKPLARPNALRLVPAVVQQADVIVRDAWRTAHERTGATYARTAAILGLDGERVRERPREWGVAGDAHLLPARALVAVQLAGADAVAYAYREEVDAALARAHQASAVPLESHARQIAAAALEVAIESPERARVVELLRAAIAHARAALADLNEVP